MEISHNLIKCFTIFYMRMVLLYKGKYSFLGYTDLPDYVKNNLGNNT